MLDCLKTLVWYLLIVALIGGPILWKLSKTFRYVIKIGAFYGAIFLTGVFVFPLVLPWPFNPSNYKTVGWMFRKLCFWTRIKWEIRGAEHLKSDHAYVLVCNHQSSIDLLGMMVVLPERCVALIKRSLLFVVGFGWSATLSGSIFVDRFNRNRAMNTMNETVEYIRNERVKLWVFPEGTRYHTFGMLPFKKGAFHVAVQAQIPVVPLIFSFYNPFYSKPERRFNMGGYVIAEALPPISTEGLGPDDVAKLTEDTRTAMLEKYAEISKEAAEINKKPNAS